MKTWIPALCVLFLLTVIVSVNTLYLGRVTRDLLAIVDALPDTPGAREFDQQIRVLTTRWKKCRPIVCLSVSHAEAELIDEAIDELCAYHRTEDKPGYAAALAALRNEIDEMRQSESLSLEGIV